MISGIENLPQRAQHRDANPKRIVPPWDSVLIKRSPMAANGTPPLGRRGTPFAVGRDSFRHQNGAVCDPSLTAPGPRVCSDGVYILVQGIWVPAAVHAVPRLYESHLYEMQYWNSLLRYQYKRIGRLHCKRDCNIFPTGRKPHDLIPGGRCVEFRDFGTSLSNSNSYSFPVVKPCWMDGLF